MSTSTEDGAPTTDTPTSQLSNNNSNNNNESHRRNNNNTNRSSNTIQLTNPKNYGGSIPEIDAILALKYEKLDKKVQYQVFIDKLSN